MRRSQLFSPIVVFVIDAMGILGLSPVALQENQYVFITTTRVPKLTRLIATSKTLILLMRTLILASWIAFSVILTFNLTDGEPQFVRAFSPSVRVQLGISTWSLLSFVVRKRLFDLSLPLEKQECAGQQFKRYVAAGIACKDPGTNCWLEFGNGCASPLSAATVQTQLWVSSMRDSCVQARRLCLPK